MDATDFLHDASARSLEFTRFNLNNPQAQRLREAYGKLIERMARAAHDKLGGTRGAV